MSSYHEKMFDGLHEGLYAYDLDGKVLSILVLVFATFKRAVGKLFTTLLPFFLLLWMRVVYAVCPHCSNHCTDCTFAENGRCPALGEMTMNAAIIGGLAAGAGRAFGCK